MNTHYIYTSDLSTLIETASVAAPPIIGTTTSGLFWDTQYQEAHYLYAGDIGPVEFTLNLPSNLAITDVLQIVIPASFNLAPEGQPLCLWNGTYAQTCDWDSTVSPNVLTLSSPNQTLISSGANMTLKITSLNANNGQNGLVLPTTSGSYPFTLQTSVNWGSTIREMQVVQVPVYAKKFTLFYSTTEVVNYNLKTSIRIQFQPQTVIPVNGQLILSIPTITNTGVTLFNNDLRSGIANGGSIPCHDVGSSFGFEPTCVLKYGSRQLGTPAQIVVTGWSSALLTSKNLLI